MGSEVARTPNLDRLADEGTVFTHGYNTASVCRPSLRTLLTGLQPVVFDQRQGLWFMARGWEAAIAAPKEKDFFRWLASQHNGLRAGQAVPPA